MREELQCAKMAPSEPPSPEVSGADITVMLSHHHCSLPGSRGITAPASLGITALRTEKLDEGCSTIEGPEPGYHPLTSEGRTPDNELNTRIALWSQQM